MSNEFNNNIRKAIEYLNEAVSLCKKGLEDANDDSCRAMYTMMMQDYRKHLRILDKEIEKHKEKNKWD
jgi:rubrerythrin